MTQSTDSCSQADETPVPVLCPCNLGHVTTRSEPQRPCLSRGIRVVVSPWVAEHLVMGVSPRLRPLFRVQGSKPAPPLGSGGRAPGTRDVLHRPVPAGRLHLQELGRAHAAGLWEDKPPPPPGAMSRRLRTLGQWGPGTPARRPHLTCPQTVPLPLTMASSSGPCTP